MTSARPHLVLLHGVTNSARIWDEVVRLLQDDFELVVPTAAGRRGGPAKDGHITVARLVDDVERTLDDLGIEKAHLVGNSLGGWIAIELARRGRALSVCAFSPAGCWTTGANDETHATETIRRVRLVARLASPLAPFALRSAHVRRRSLQDVAVRGERLTRQQALEIARDLIGCVAAPDLLGTAENLASLDPLPCPVTLAWSAEDRIFSPQVNGVRAQQLFPGTTYIHLDNVGHVPRSTIRHFAPGQSATRRLGSPPRIERTSARSHVLCR